MPSHPILGTVRSSATESAASEWGSGQKAPGNRQGHSTFILGATLVLLLMVGAAAAPLLAPYDPYRQLDPASARYRPPGTVLPMVVLTDGGLLLADRVERTPEGLLVERLGGIEVLASQEVANLSATGVADRVVFLLGSDKFGRDLGSRLLYGARLSLFVGFLSVALALTVGIAVGSAAALGGPLVDTLIMRLVDSLLAFPRLILVLVIAALYSQSPWAIVLLLGGTGWMGISRLLRAELLSLQEQSFVLAARGLGSHPLRILTHHLMPNALTPVLVSATLMIGQTILTEATLSFLGLGIQPPRPSWGNMVAEGREALYSAWWVAAFPGALTALTVIAFNTLGDGLRDRLDPRASRALDGQRPRLLRWLTPWVGLRHRRAAGDGSERTR